MTQQSIAISFYAHKIFPRQCMGRSAATEPLDQRRGGISSLPNITACSFTGTARPLRPPAPIACPHHRSHPHRHPPARPEPITSRHIPCAIAIPAICKFELQQTVTIAVIAKFFRFCSRWTVSPQPKKRNPTRCRNFDIIVNHPLAHFSAPPHLARHVMRPTWCPC